MESKEKDAVPFNGSLTPVDAANAIRSARVTARDLLDTAEILFTLKRFQHSTAMSILAIEESSKLALLLMIFLGIGGDRGKLWRAYRNHRAKTAWLNPAIESRIRATFPQISREDAKRLAEAGPSPEDLEASKQRAIYSDCFETSGNFISHCPNLAEWRNIAWERLCEAQAMVTGARDYPPEELRIWQKQVSRATAEGRSPLSSLPALHQELLEKRLIKEDWWKTLLEDAEFEARRNE